MVKTAYGNRSDTQKKIEEKSIMRILECIMNEGNMPGDIAECAVRRCSNPLSFKGIADWRNNLSIACSAYNGYTGGKYKMTLEKDRKTRDYLYGRLLAMADLLESSALRKTNEDRQTTAIRYMQRFSEFPYTTWEDIELALVPYKARLGKMVSYYESEISKIMDMFEGDDFRNNKKLSGEFLLAYHCQREEHFRGKNTDNEEEE
ncbi:type I-C CRISPR-associated protein Cas8c/Csd1 [Candidatus Methanomethylophilus sp. 1R26]|uniref:type I-C CRISPR-associated protein Cas8c/Csd1 n=1 Tax=Candidatus Methanomethylophilus sp. 1R26 TaxID=1769296 RepID=UPI0012FF30B9|nr:type I-C CRISPR-associated protein Cas8c/Csd1 [Candidatus Methanomethylophilus sp. 1R26]